MRFAVNREPALFLALAEREELKSNILCLGWWGTDEKRGRKIGAAR
jgi:hypothetical protein